MWERGKNNGKGGGYFEKGLSEIVVNYFIFM
jgi:hypothetical protein